MSRKEVKRRLMKAKETDRNKKEEVVGEDSHQGGFWSMQVHGNGDFFSKPFLKHIWRSYQARQLSFSRRWASDLRQSGQANLD
eukprot:1151909-Pelagomonas_calceolata.AAC.2